MKKKPTWNKDLKIPFTPGKGMVIYFIESTTEYIDNHIFDGVLGLTGFYSTGSSYLALFKDIITGLTYHMYISDFDQLVRQGRFKKSYITGKFVYAKKGNFFSIKLYE